MTRKYKYSDMQILHGNNIELLKQFPDNYFDAVVTDPPYGLGKEPDAVEVMQSWVINGYHEVKGGGFMGKEWDAFVPQPNFWKEVYRVLKHGGHVVSFFGTRTYDWGVMAMRFAGFEVRDCIQWIYGSGFPKSHNIGKAIDKLEGNERDVVGISTIGGGGASTKGLIEFGSSNNEKGKKGLEITKGQSEWEGWGSALKPANEPIVLARKPLEKGLSIAENVLKYGTGGINIDGCRVGLSKGDDSRLGGNGTWKTHNAAKNLYEGGWKGKDISSSPLGRFPANLILTHHSECVCKGMKSVKGTSTGNRDETIGEESKGVVKPFRRGKFINRTDENGKETVEDWECHTDCPIRIMDEQSGVLKSGDLKPYKNKIDAQYSQFHSEERNVHFRGDSCGASRFFYCAKVSKSERNKGLDSFEEKVMKGRDEGQDERSVAYKPRPTPMANIHPTVKPVKLMQYLARLITPPNGKVLDPFCGSGTTGIACKLEGFEFVGMEQDAEYCKIAEGRINNHVDGTENTLTDDEKDNRIRRNPFAFRLHDHQGQQEGI